MTQITFTKEDLSSPDVVNFDAVLRIKDLSGFFDRNHRRLGAMLSVVANTEAHLMYIAMEPEVLITMKKSGLFIPGDPMYEDSTQKCFNLELVRVALLLEKLALMIAPEAVIEVDFPPMNYLAGKTLYPFFKEGQEFFKEIDNKVSVPLSEDIPRELDRKLNAYIDFVFPPKNYMMGLCHWIWGMKKMILRYGFNLDWKSPSERNPGVIFD